MGSTPTVPARPPETPSRRDHVLGEWADRHSPDVARAQLRAVILLLVGLVLAASLFVPFSLAARWVLEFLVSFI